MLFVFLVSCTVAAILVFRWRRRRLYELAERIGGMEKIPVLGHLLSFAGNTEQIMGVLKSVSYYSIENGGITAEWIAHIPMFVLTDPVDCEYVLKTCNEKDDLHRFFRDIVGNGILMAPVPIWKSRRKTIIPAFTPKIVDNFVDVFAEKSMILQRQLKNKLGAGTFDVWPFFSRYTLDSVSETVMGSQIDAQTKNDTPFLESLNKVLNLTCSRFFKIWLHSDLIFKLASTFNHYAHHLSVLNGFVDKVVIAKTKEIGRRNNSEAQQCNGLEAYKRKTFLDILIESANKKNGYSTLELREEVLSLTIAGTDTTAVAMSFTLLLLGKYPDVQEKVYKELLDIYGESDEVLVKEDLEKMVYLERVIKESLRLYPPVPFLTRKSDTEVILPSGKILPANTGLAISVYGLHRNKKYWGEDAEIFEPDRFSPDRFNLAQSGAYIPFGSGLRSCLGYRYAINSIKTSISTVLRKYRVVVPEENLNAKIRVKIDIMLKSVTGYEVQLEERKHRK